MHSSVHTVESNASQKIAHDQMNKSHSKQLFSFPKTERFASTKKIYCNAAAYELGTTLNKRSTNLGYGTKSDFTKIDLNKPGPDRYSIVSVFEVERSKKKGYTFSLGREDLKFRNIQNNKQTPGPGYYYQDDSEQSRKYQFSMGKRTLNTFSISTSKDVPGPAQYELIGMNRTGNYFVSKFSGSKASVFSPPTSTRFAYQNKTKYIPGPGTYNLEAFTDGGRYFNSKLRSAAGGKFSIQERNTYTNTKEALLSPGPGAYRILSEFGDTDFPPINGGSPSQKLSKSISVNSFRKSNLINSQNGKNLKSANSNIEDSKSNLQSEQLQKNKNQIGNSNFKNSKVNNSKHS